MRGVENITRSREVPRRAAVNRASGSARNKLEIACVMRLSVAEV